MIEKAIRQRTVLSFAYRKGETIKSYSSVAPYRLINSKSIWYLAAVDQKNLKTFNFTKISNLQASTQPFDWDSEIEAHVDGEDSIWFGEEKQLIRLAIDAKVASYFERRKLVPQQEIVQKNEDGRIELTSSVVHLTQIFPIIRYWVPHVRVLEPAGLQEQLNDELRCYLQSFKGGGVDIYQRAGCLTRFQFELGFFIPKTRYVKELKLSETRMNASFSWCFFV